MSKPLKVVQYGLGVVKRNWSIPSATQEPRCSPSPIPLNPVQPAARKLTGSEHQACTSSEKARPGRKLPHWQSKDFLLKSNLTRQSRKTTKTKTIRKTPISMSSVREIAPVSLSQEQIQILKLVEDGNSIFYTGSAGTGKSILLREIIKTLRKKYFQDAVAITASTGIAACNIGGVTIHSFAGIGLGMGPANLLVNKIKQKNRKAYKRWGDTSVLIIDEVSMIDGDLFDKLAQIAKIVKNSIEPFGGIQVIVTGDFFQLPPVMKGSNQVKFAFEAQSWKETVKHTYNLTKVFRQSDPTFVDMLNEMRFGTLSSKSIESFKQLSRSIEYEDGLVPTELFPRREDVERSNLARMNQLTTEEETFDSFDEGQIEDMEQREKMLGSFMAPQRLTLRVGAQVMLIKNVDEMLVNGSIGKVLRFIDPAIYGTLNDPEVASGAFVGGVPSQTAGCSAAEKFAAIFGVRRYPVVEFFLRNGIKKRVLVMPESWTVELPSGEIQVSRTQVPLILSWALSIHKSQGQTLERVKVDLGKVFEKGQAYVALSRATTLEGLQVLNFDATKVQAHPMVVDWSKTLSTISDS